MKVRGEKNSDDEYGVFMIFKCPQCGKKNKIKIDPSSELKIHVICDDDMNIVGFATRFKCKYCDKTGLLCSEYNNPASKRKKVETDADEKEK